jgi:hypothetical protein
MSLSPGRDKGIDMRYRIIIFCLLILASCSTPRTEAWNLASHDWKTIHPVCAICGSHSNLEAHDVLPYHLLTNKQKNDYGFLIKNMVTLCHDCHFKYGHNSDPDWLDYSKDIRKLQKY